MNIKDSIFLASLFLAAGLFFRGLLYGIQKDIKYAKFMSLGMIAVGLSDLFLLEFYGVNLTAVQINSLVIATVLFLVLSLFFYYAYRIAEDQENKKI